MSRLIDADALKRAIKTECNPYGKPTIDFESGKKVLEIIDDAPTIDSLDLDVHIGGRCCGKRQRLLDELRPKGKWIKCNPLVQDKYMLDDNEYFKCSECYCSCRKTHNYCPNCGARMEKWIEGDKNEKD